MKPTIKKEQSDGATDINEVEEATDYSRHDGAAEEQDNSDRGSADAVYDMFCELSPADKATCIKRMQEHYNGAKKNPLSRDAGRKFTMGKKEDF